MQIDFTVIGETSVIQAFRCGRFILLDGELSVNEVRQYHI